MNDINDDVKPKPRQTSEHTDQLLVRKLLYSKVVETGIDNIQKNKEPPDKDIREDNVRLRYDLTMRAMRGTRLNQPLPPKEEES